MKPSRVRFLLVPAVFLAGATFAHAHPGHDGHELTWDLGHLAAHPVATFGCLAVALAALVGGGWLVARTTMNRAQTLRSSQPSRGK